MNLYILNIQKTFDFHRSILYKNLCLPQKKKQQKLITVDN